MNPQCSLTMPKGSFRLAKWCSTLILFAATILLPAGTPFAEGFNATTVGDLGRVTVMEVTGNFDANNPDGTVNAAAREAVAQEFYRTHRDEFDYLILVTNFDFAMPEAEAKAFYMGVKNDTRGIGQELFDNTSFFGSAGRLQGTIDMGNLAGLVTDPLDPAFENTFYVLNHELMHRWGARVKFRGADGHPSDALLGKDGSHWSFLLDSQGSVLYGNSWHDNGDGTFTAQEGRNVFSPLDLYLMGIYDKSRVPPLLLIDNPSVAAGQLPRPGTTISGTPRYVSIDDIIAEEGERFPAAADAQKKFNAALILLTSPGSFTGDETAGLERLLKGWLTRYSILTDAAAIMSATAAPVSEVATNPGTGTGNETPRTVPASADDGVSWLLSVQKEDGSWSSVSQTTDRETSAAASALRHFPLGAGAASRGLAWIGVNGAGNTDFLAAKIAALADAGQSAPEQTAALLVRQNSDGGWGSEGNYLSNPIDTTLAVKALLAASSTDPAIGRGIEYLLQRQNGDGGWGFRTDAASAVLATAEVLATMQKAPASGAVATAVRQATAFLLSHQNVDGGFGSSPSTVYETALAYRALSGVITDTGVLGGAIRYISSTQGESGAWGADPYTTALALDALYIASKKPAAPPPPTTGTVTGTVVDSTSHQPLAGAMVTLADDPSIATTTGVAGAFSLAEVPQGPRTIAVSLNGYIFATAAVQVTAGAVIDLGSVSLSPAPTTGIIKGVATAAGSGQPLAGVSIIVTGSFEGTLTTATDGSFTIGNVTPGSVAITASKPGYDPVSTTGTVSAGVSLSFNPRLAPTAVAPTTGAVTGRVTDAATAHPLAGVSVALSSAPATAAITDANGVFLLSGVPQGNQSLSLSASGYAGSVVAATVVAGLTTNLGSIPLSADHTGSAIRGSVSDAATGEALAGATVALRGAFTGTTVTGNDGSFAVSGVGVGGVTLVVSKAGYYPLNISGVIPAEGTLLLTPRLTPLPVPPSTGAMAGKVVDAATGQPLSGVSVTMGGTPTVALNTDANGAFTIAGVAPGTQTVEFTLAGYAGARAKVEVAAGSTVNLGKLPLAANPTTAAIRGTITDAAGGVPLAGATVSVAGDYTGSAVTAADGTFEIAGVTPGSLTITASKGGYLAVTGSPTLAAGDLLVFSPKLALLPPPPSTGTVTGKMVDAATREPLPGVSVTLEGGAGIAAVTDATGSFVLAELPPGTQSIDFTRSGYAGATARLNVVAGFLFDLGELPLSSDPTTATFKGKISDAATGKEIEGATVTIAGASASTTVTGSDGSFLFSELAPGELSVAVTKTGYYPVTGTATLASGAVFFLDLQLAVIPPQPTSGTVMGMVVEAATNLPLAGVAVALDGNPAMAATTDATGSFTLSGIPPGIQSVTFTLAGYATVMGTLEIAPGAVLDIGSLRLYTHPTTGLIRGTVTTASGQPLAGVAVSATGSLSASVTTAADGSFIFSEVPPGGVTLIATRSGYYSVTATGAASAGGILLANLQMTEIPPLPATGVLAGKVLDGVTAAPIQGAVIYLLGINPATSDAQGGFSLGSVTPGSYQITVSAPGHVSQILQVAVVAGSSEVQTVYLTPLFQSSTVTGQVTDASTGLPVAGADVGIPGTGISVKTDAAGSYTIPEIQLSEFSLRASAAGYDTRSVLIRTTSYVMRAVDFVLTPSKGSDTLTLKSVAVDQPSYQAAQVVGITAVVENSGSTAAEVALIGRIVDAQGNIVAVLSPLGATTVLVAPAGTKSVTLQWGTGQVPPGPYTVSLLVSDPANGILLGQKEASFAIASSFTLSNAVLTVSPTFTYTDKSETLKLSSLLTFATNGTEDIDLDYTLKDAQGTVLRQGTATATLSPPQQTVYQEIDQFTLQFAAGVYALELAIRKDGATLRQVAVPFTVLSNVRIDTGRSVAPVAVPPDASGKVTITIQLKGEAK